MARPSVAARGLALAFLCAEWSPPAMAAQVRQLLGLKGRQKRLLELAEAVCRHWPGPPLPTQDQLARAISCSPKVRQLLRRIQTGELIPDALQLPPLPMRPAAGLPADWNLPELLTAGQLAEWLGITPTELDWLADVRQTERHRPPGVGRHYHYRWIPKSHGRQRLLEAPRPRLKAIQRQLLHGLLDRIEPHAAAFAFRRGRSLAGFLAPHAGRRIVLHVDLRDFFPSIRASRVNALFRTAGYPEAIARLLTGLCTNAAPAPVLRGETDSERSAATRQIYGSPHLPQGAPTSPALANLCAWRLDARLAGLARKTSARYTRYADDLLFSGGRELERALPRFRVWVGAIAMDEGFSIQRRKTRRLPRSGRQQVAGVLLNEHPNIPRDEYDRLRATLFNCGRYGPASQNHQQHPRFREHLAGRIAWVNLLNPARGEKLRRLFDRIEWDAATE